MPQLRRYSLTKLCDGAQMASFGDILRPVFSASRMQHASDLRLKFALGHAMCGGMVYTQSATAEIRRGKKERRQKKRSKIEETTGQKYNGLPDSIGRT